MNASTSECEPASDNIFAAIGNHRVAWLNYMSELNFLKIVTSYQDNEDPEERHSQKVFETLTENVRCPRGEEERAWIQLCETKITTQKGIRAFETYLTDQIKRQSDRKVFRHVTICLPAGARMHCAKPLNKPTQKGREK